MTTQDVEAVMVRSWERAAARDLRRRFPVASVWHGTHTGSWWAVLNLSGVWRLVEAETPEDLSSVLASLLGDLWVRRHS
jgi:hypothetical protein